MTNDKARGAIEAVCWVVVTAVLVWRVIFGSVTIVSNMALLVLFAFNFFQRADSFRKSVLVLLLVDLLAAYSLLLENSVSNIVRFSLILAFVSCAYYVRPANPRKFINILATVTAPFAVLLIVFELLLLFYFDDATCSLIRHIVLDAGLGDVYRQYKFLYRVHLSGCAILPFLYMLVTGSDLFARRAKRQLRIIYLIASICAGNFMFFMGIAAYHFLDLILSCKSRRWLYRHIPLWLAVFTVVPFFLRFVGDTLEEKKDYSNAIRVEQVEMLWTDMAENLGTLLLGKGLGNTISASGMRTYNEESRYFEVQVAYFLNQMGLLPFAIFVCFSIFQALKFIKARRLRLAYLCYIMYALSNPYLLDTTQVVVIIALLCAVRIKNADDCKSTTKIQGNVGDMAHALLQ